MQAATSALVTTALAILVPNGEAGGAGVLAGALTGAQAKPGQAKAGETNPGDATQTPGADAFAQMLAAALGIIAPLAQGQAQTQAQPQAADPSTAAIAASAAPPVAAPTAAQPPAPAPAPDAGAASTASTASDNAQAGGAISLLAVVADELAAALAQAGSADAAAPPAQAPGSAKAQDATNPAAGQTVPGQTVPGQLANRQPAPGPVVAAAVTAPPPPELVPTAALVAQTPPPDPATDAPPPAPSSLTSPALTAGSGVVQTPGQIAQTVVAPVLAATAQTQAGDDSPAQPASPAQPSASTAVILAAAADAAAKSGGQDASGQAPDGNGGEASPQGSARFDAPTAAAGFTAAAPTAAAQTSALAFAQVLPQTITRLAADIASKFGSKSTRFDVALEPAGLGRVDVKVHIGADGVMTAALNFDTSHAAEALKARAGELRAALEQAGFSLGGGALSFTGGGSGGAGGSAGGNPSGQAFTQTPFDLAAQTADTAPIALTAAGRPGGVDIHI